MEQSRYVLKMPGNRYDIEVRPPPAVGEHNQRSAIGSERSERRIAHPTKSGSEAEPSCAPDEVGQRSGAELCTRRSVLKAGGFLRG